MSRVDSLHSSYNDELSLPQHDGDLANECFLMFCLNGILAIFGDCLLDVHVQGGGVGEVPQPGLVGHHGGGGAVLLPVSWLGEVNLLKLEEVFGRVLDLPVSVLGLALQLYLRRVLHNPLDIHLDKLVKGVQLLSHQTFIFELLEMNMNRYAGPTFLLKIGRDDSPTCLLPDLVGDLLCIVPLIHVVLFLLIHDGRVILLALELEYQLL